MTKFSIPIIEPVIEGNIYVGPYTTLGLVPQATAANRRPLGERFVQGSIGDGCVIGANVTIYAGVRLGRDCRVGDGAVIREGCSFGDRCVIGSAANILYNVTCGDDVRILNCSHITGETEIGDESFIGPSVSSANDPYVAKHSLTEYQHRGQKGPVIGKRVFIGVAAILLPGVKIGDGAVIGAGSLVTKDVPAEVIAIGIPARAMMK